MFENIGESWVTDTQLRKDVRSFLTVGTLNTTSLRARISTNAELSHEADEFDDIIMTIELFCPSVENPAKVGSVAVSFQALVEWGGRDIMPSVDESMREVTGKSEADLTAALNEVGDTLTAYADAFIKLGPEPQSSIDAVERLKVRAFLSGESAAELHGTSGSPLIVSAEMDVSTHDPAELANKRLTVDVRRKSDTASNPVGKIMATVGRAVNERLVSYLLQFDLSPKEVEAIDEHVHTRLTRFIELGAEPERV